MKLAAIKPRLDYYFGRNVKAVEKWGDDPWAWMIVLDGDIQIQNHEEKNEWMPDNIIGLSFSTATYSLEDTTMHFMGGMENQRVSLNPTKYSVVDPTLPTAEEKYFPQMDEDNIGAGPPEYEAAREQRQQREVTEFLSDEDAEKKEEPKKTSRGTTKSKKTRKQDKGE